MSDLTERQMAQLRSREMMAEARLNAVAPKFVSACIGNHEPVEDEAMWRLGWLKTLLEVCWANFDAIAGDDPDATDMMLSEVSQLHHQLSAAVTNARGEP